MSSSLVLNWSNLHGLRHEALRLGLDLRLTERGCEQRHVLDHSEGTEGLLGIHGLVVGPLGLSYPACVLAAVIWIAGVGLLHAVVHIFVALVHVFEVLESVVEEEQPIDLLTLL